MPPAGGLNTARVAPSASSLQTLVAAAILIAGMYFARDVLVPFALALLLTFLLAPAVLRLRRFGLGRIPAVMVTVVVAFSFIGLIGWVVAGQLLNLANQLPGYQQNISTKLRSFQGTDEGLLERTSRVLSELNRDLAAGAAPAAGSPAEPVAVTVTPPATSPLDTIEAYVSPLLDPLATAGIVVVLVIFMLVQREDLRDRFIGLVGTTRMNVTTQALDDAAKRISRYLLMQLLVNVAYGVPVGVGLYLIGVPNAMLWGVLAALLRFVPYVGPLIAMALPLLLAFAVDPGWNMLLMTAGLFFGLEIVSNNVVEPWLYGSSTGMSSVAIMVAAIFWTWLWGPIGLLLSTPLTVCLAVAGRYVPQLSFLSVLLGNEPALRPEARLYQRMLAMDFEEASQVAGELLEKMPLIQVYDELVIPALSLAETDRHEGVLDEERKRFIIENTRELVVELADIHYSREPQEAGPGGSRLNVVVLPARDDSDEMAGLMLRELLRRDERIAVDLRPAGAAIDAQIGHVRRVQPDLVVVSSVPPAAVRHAVHVCRHLKTDLPDVRVAVGLWSTEADAARLRARLPEALAERLFTRLDEALGWVRSLAEPSAGASMVAPAVPADESARLEALRRTRLLDTPPEEAFDRVTRRLSEIFDAPISLMSLIDEERQFWKSQHGLPEALASARQASRELSVCGHVVAGDEPIVVEDTLADPRFAGNPFLREHNIRFYAGAPLRTSDGSAIGSLCVIDHRPRRVTERDRQLLALLADTVMAEVEALALAREHAERERAGCVLDTDLARARAVQALLAPPAHQTVGRTVVGHRLTPGSTLPGAFTVTRVRADGSVAIILGDAGAGGLSGPLLATAVAATAGRLLEEQATPGDVLTALNRMLRADEGGVPLSCTAAFLSPLDGRLDVAAAGYCPPILVRDGAAVPVELDAVEPPLLTDGEWIYRAGRTIDLDAGDQVLFYTEGAVDVSGSGGLLGVDGLAALAGEHQHADVDAWLSSVDAVLSRASEASSAGWSLLALAVRPTPVPVGSGESQTGIGPGSDRGSS